VIQDYFYLVWSGFKKRKMRSYLTILGIVIGVTAILALATLGEELERSVTQQFDKFGTRRLFIGPKQVGATGPPTGVSDLTEKDLETVRRASFVDYVVPMYMEKAQVEYNRKKVNHDVMGFDTSLGQKAFEDIDVHLEEGRWLEKGDTNSIVIGYGIAHSFFDKEVRVKNSLKIDGIKFRVVGIIEQQGSQNDDNAIRVPIERLRELKGRSDAISGITAVVKKGMDMEVAHEKLKERLKRKRNDENFEVTSPVKIKEQAGAVIGVVQWVVMSIAFISLIVGGIGIMNSMYTSVLERTRDIGVMKAIGAKNKDISSVFLIESGLLGLVGGVIGVILGFLLSFVMVSAVNLAGVVTLHFSLQWGYALFGIVFSFIVGVVFGVLPAIRASQMKPVDALRYE
jgi:putative ABC transport system permease protein